jgi:hypothetical protein
MPVSAGDLKAERKQKSPDSSGLFLLLLWIVTWYRGRIQSDF